MPGPQLLVVLRHAESARNAAKTGKVFFNDARDAAGVFKPIPRQRAQETD